MRPYFLGKFHHDLTVLPHWKSWLGFGQSSPNGRTIQVSEIWFHLPRLIISLWLIVYQCLPYTIEFIKSSELKWTKPTCRTKWLNIIIYPDILGGWTSTKIPSFQPGGIVLVDSLLGMDLPAGTSLVAMDPLEWGGMGYLYGYLTVMAMYQL